MRGWLAALLLALAGPASAGPAPEPPLDRLSRLVERLGAEGDFSGAAVILRDGEEVWARGVGFADRAALRRFTPDTPSDTGSIAKTVTGTLVLAHVMAGRLDLSDPVTRWLPDFPHRDTTLRDLLAHSAGLPDYDAFLDLYEPGPLTNGRVLAALAQRHPRPDFAPGSRFRYCNLCLDALAEVVARAGGEPYATQAIDGLLTPLGAAGAFVRPARFADWPVPRTIGYRGTEHFDAFDREAVEGASNIMLSARDLARWADAWARGHGVPAAVRALATAGRGPGLTPGQWNCNPARTRCHYTGHHQGYDALALWDRAAGLAIAYVSNGGLSPWLNHRLGRLLLDAAEGRAPVLDPEPRGCRTPTEVRALAGRWRLPDGSAALVWRAGDGAWQLSVPGAPAAQLFRVGPGQFYAPGLDRFLCLDGDRLRAFGRTDDQVGLRDGGAGR
jgi:CubicO group peptidase (beta-lactamase class C family)